MIFMEQPMPPLEDVVKSPEITFDKKTSVIKYHNLNLDATHPTTPEVTLTIKKLPLPIIEGKIYGHYAVLVDTESEKMKIIVAQAEALKSLPETQRIRAVMELLRTNVHYAYNDAIDAVAKTNPDLANWIAINTGLNSSASEIPLSEIFEKEYGICRHLSVAYLWLAQKAGLQGVLCRTREGTIKNIVRTDNGERLFKSFGVGETTSGHMWTEIQLSDGTWIPVDPSTKLVADTPEGLEMFKQANYITLDTESLYSECSPGKLSPVSTELRFTPGQPSSEVKYSLFLNSTRPISDIFSDNDIPPTNIPYSGNGQLEIGASKGSADMNFEFTDVK
jgi:hypothetical protein